MFDPEEQKETGETYHRRVLDSSTLLEVNDEFEQVLRARGVWSEALAA